MSTRSSTPISGYAGSVGTGGAAAAGTGASSQPVQGASSAISSSATAGGNNLQAYLGVVRSRTLLFQSYRDSVPRTTRAGANDDYSEYGASSNATIDLKGKGKQPRQGSYYDGNAELRLEEGEDERAGLLNGAAEPGSSYPPTPAHTALDLSTLPPKWVDTSDEVDNILSTCIKPKITQLDRLHAKHLLPSFTDRSKEEREIEELTTEITREFRKCSKLIASLAQHTQRQQERPSKSGPSSAPALTNREMALAQNVQTAMATKVQDLSGVFRKKQSVYLQRLKGMEVRGRDLAAASGMLSKNGVMHRDSAIAVREDMELSRQQLKTSAPQSDSLLLLEEQELANPTDSQADANIHQRDREITQIAKSIAELAELFQDLSSLVIEQGTMVDRIDWNVENMSKDIHAAVEELNTAQR